MTKTQVLVNSNVASSPIPRQPVKMRIRTTNPPARSPKPPFHIR